VHDGWRARIEHFEAAKHKIRPLRTDRARVITAEDMREEYMTDRKDRRVRLLRTVCLPSGNGLVRHSDGSRDHMQISFQYSRKRIVGDYGRMKVDVDSYNDAYPDAVPIQIVFDAELEAAEECFLILFAPPAGLHSQSARFRPLFRGQVCPFWPCSWLFGTKGIGPSLACPSQCR
jgi:hypothetical protein